MPFCPLAAWCIAGSLTRLPLFSLFLLLFLLYCSRRRALFLDFSAVVDAAQADGALSGDAAVELRRLAYAFMGCLADIYAVGAGPGRETDRAAFLARARRALQAASYTAAEALQHGAPESLVMKMAVEAAAEELRQAPPPLLPAALPQAAAAVAAA